MSVDGGEHQDVVDDEVAQHLDDCRWSKGDMLVSGTEEEGAEKLHHESKKILSSSADDFPGKK